MSIMWCKAKNIFCQTADWRLLKCRYFSQLQLARNVAIFGAGVAGLLRQGVFPGLLGPGRA